MKAECSLLLTKCFVFNVLRSIATVYYNLHHVSEKVLCKYIENLNQVLNVHFVFVLKWYTLLFIYSLFTFSMKRTNRNKSRTFAERSSIITCFGLYVFIYW